MLLMEVRMLTMTLEQWKLTKHQAKHGVPVPDRATAEWQGKHYEQIDAHGAIFALARRLVPLHSGFDGLAGAVLGGGAVIFGAAALGGFRTFAGNHSGDKSAPKVVVSTLLDWSPRGEAKRQIKH
jgi:hypothetical protein